MRACSAGNSSSQSGSRSRSAALTSASVMVPSWSRAACQVLTVIYGVASRMRSWSTTARSISPAGILRTGQVSAPFFRTDWLT